MKNEILPGKSKLEIERVRGERIEQAVNGLLSISPDTKRNLRFPDHKPGKSFLGEVGAGRSAEVNWHAGI